MHLITRESIESILSKWASGELNADEVQTWAGNRYMVDEYETESDNVNEILARLDMLDMNLTTIEDIPVLVSALKADNYISILEKHNSKIDIVKRKKELQNLSPYKEFCK